MNRDGAALIDRLTEAAAVPDPRPVMVAVLSETWRAGRERIAARLAGGLGGVEVARAYAALADEVVGALWTVTATVLHPPASTKADALSLVAVGGYGRGVLAPFSDLDLLFLSSGRASPRGEAVASFCQHVLWDMGLKLGAASRSISECLSAARTDMTVRTTLLEARVVAGDERLTTSVLTRFRREVARADQRPFIRAKLAERDVRHIKAGAVRYRVEPNIKDGKGGLRDLNTLFWIARSLAPDSPLGERALADLLTARERRTFEEAFDFLWRVRCHLHLTAGRAEEKLTFDLQPEVARRMGWRGRGDEPAVERFMRRYFLVARDVGGLTRAMSAKLEARQQKRAMGLSRLFPARRRRLADPAFVAVAGRLTVADANVFREEPLRLLTLFCEADAHDLDLHPDAFSAVTRSLDLVTPRLRRDPAAAQAFLDILAHGQRPYRVLSMMNDTGLLGRFLPEFGRVVGQTQFNMYHAYTVDEHTLQAIGVINDIARGKLRADHPAASEIVHRIDDIEVLMLGMLLHDVGKGGARGQLEDGAIAARRACERLGLDPRRAELVAWLVRHHLSLSDFAQKRDVSDPRTVSLFAEMVGDRERLRMLLVLTVADIRAVGPGIWNAWKGQLMRDLYSRAEALFGGMAVAPSVSDLPAEQEAMLARLVETGRPQVAARQADETTEIVLVAPDRTGLFADLAAAMAAAGADVAGARLATLDGVALDIFQVQDGAGRPYGEAEPRRLTRLLTALQDAAVGGGKPQRIEGRPNPRRAAFDVRPVVMIDTASSDTATVIEVSGADRPFLLADLARVISERRLSIRSAHVARYGERAVDSFYVVDGRGRPVRDEARLAMIRAALEAAVEAPAGPGRAPAGELTKARASDRDVSELGRPAQKPAPSAKTAAKAKM
jgi:[protein-PII] uridylyltransferase